MKQSIKYIILFLFLLTVNLTIGQPTQIKFEHLSIEDGLSQSSVSSIAQDEHGFMWFGTLDGLNRYDGYNFRKYYSSKDTNSIPSNIITKILNDNENILWIATEKGLCKYNKLHDNFIRIIDTETMVHEQYIIDIKDYGNNIWIATKEALYLLNKETNTIENIELPKELSNKTITNIYYFNAYIWIISDNMIFRYNHNENKYKSIKLFDGTDKIKKLQSIIVTKNRRFFLGTNNYLAELIILDKGVIDINIIENNINVSSIIEDEHGTLWIGSKNQGLLSYNIKLNKIIKHKYNFSDPQSISTNYIKSLYYSKNGILWIGNNLGGINKWNRFVEDIIIIKNNPFKKNSLSSNMVRCIYKDSKNRTWVGTVDRGLNLWIIDNNIFKNHVLIDKNNDTTYSENYKAINETADGEFFDFKNNEFKIYENNPNNSYSLPNNHVRSILESLKGNLWVGTDGGGLCLLDEKTGRFKVLNTNNSGISNNNIWKIYQDTKGNIWIATNGGGLNLLNEDNKTFKVFKTSSTNNKTISSNHVSTIYEDSKGNLWIGTLNNGFNKFNYADSTFTRFSYHENDTTSIPFKCVYSITEDSKGNIWLGLKGCLSKFDFKNNKFYSYTTANGLPNDVVMGILEDDKEHLWISTNNGICEFKIDSGVVRNYTVNDGLQGNEFLVGSFLKTGTGTLSFGGINGFNAFKPSKLRLNKNKPSVVITEFKIFNNPAKIDTVISEKQEIVLNWDENIFSLGFVSIDYIASEENRYKIKLEGIDEDWIDYGTRRYVSYNNLPAGDYIFRVIGSNNDGIWNEIGATIKITILPPWWETTWFRISVLIFIIIIVLAWVKQRERKLKNEKQILEEKVKQRTKKIQEQKDDIEKKNTELEMALEEVETQKDEIENQKDEIETQRDTVLVQKNEIEIIHHEISESINYAKRLQDSILPDINIENKKLTDHFILFNPKDKVSGDFFWWTYMNDYVIITASDCTGHGVPGAFMSLLGISFLREIIIKEETTFPSAILNNLRNEIIKTLKQKGEIGEQKDGMDMALISINFKTNAIQFAGANNPLYIITDTELSNIQDNESIKLIDNSYLDIESTKILYEIKPDKMPIAIYDNMKDFTTHEIQLKKGDQVYMFSDGYADQFGGPKGKKFKYKPFKRLLLDNSHKPMQEQKEILETTFENWRGNLEQVDDVVIIGVTI